MPRSQKPSYLAEFAARFREALTRAGLKQTHFAARSGIAYPTVNSYACGKKLPAGREAQKIAAVLKGQLEWIMTGYQPSPVVQQMLEVLDDLPPAQQDLLARCTMLIRRGDPKAISGLEAYVRGFLAFYALSDEVRQSQADVSESLMAPPAQSEYTNP